MAMTNEEIIFGEKMTRGITETIHTFEKWKSLGYKVKKGEKSEIKFPIWKYGKGKSEEPEEDADGNETKKKKGGYCFMKMSAFFKESQVEPMKVKG